MLLADVDLIARVQRHRDHHAFAELVRRYQSPVRSFLTKMTRGDSHLADDLAQMTFLKVWRNLLKFRGEGKFATWLFKIAVNEYRGEARRRKEFALEDLDDPPVGLEETGAADTSNLRLDLAAALLRLNAAERAVIVLCCQNGLSHGEAAKVMDCPLGTVKTNVQRGKEKLRRWLAM